MKNYLRASGHREFFEFFGRTPLGRLLDLESLLHLSEQAVLCPLQDPFRIRVRFLGWKSASLLLDEKGDLRREKLKELIEELEKGLYPFNFEEEGDASIFLHLLSSLQKLQSEETLWRALKRCSMPLSNQLAVEIVKDTLWPEEIGSLQTVHVRRAVLTAWLTLLRQGTGSCFATAPALLIQRENPLLLIQDLDALLSSGELRRGSYSVPLYAWSAPGEWQKPISLANFPPVSPGLCAGLRSAGLPFPKKITGEIIPQKFFEEKLLEHFGLDWEDVEREKSSATVQFGVLWERGGGHFEGISPKTKQIHDWEKAKNRAMRAFLAVADCPLLRSWEYALASFCDVKVEFAKWNLYVSLGMHPEERPPGIGAYFLQCIQEKFDGANRHMAELQEEYQRAAHQAHAAETLLKSSLDEGRRQQLKAELLTAVHAVHSLSSFLAKEHARTEWLSKLFPLIFHEAIEKLQAAFQEVFDPSLEEKERDRMEDGLAGFRLLYKSGRSAAASWEKIEEEGQFVNCIYRFFESLENQVAIEPDRQGDFTALMTQLLQYIRTAEFLKNAILRSKENRVAKNAKPWSYQSGGTMQTLLQSYFQMPSSPKEISRPIYTPLELLNFLQDIARETAENSLLIHSPTHAFLFDPTSLRLPISLERGNHFLKELSLTFEQAHFLIDRFAMRLPEEKRSLFYAGCREVPFAGSIKSLRNTLFAGFIAAKEFREELIDGFLYESLPVLTFFEAKRAVELLLESLHLPLSGPILEPSSPFLTSRELILFLKKILFAHGALAFSSTDWDLAIASEARKAALAYPQPILFGDTNWSDWSFGFVQNFLSGELELWRLNRTGLRGMPMGDWKQLFQEGGRWTILRLYAL